MPTTRGGTKNRKHAILPSIPHNTGTGLATLYRNSVVKQLPSSQERRGDDKLDRARGLTDEFESVLAETDLRTIEDKIAQ